jgi:hypothetical protein
MLGSNELTGSIEARQSLSKYKDSTGIGASTFSSSFFSYAFAPFFFSSVLASYFLTVGTLMIPASLRT